MALLGACRAVCLSYRDVDVIVHPLLTAHSVATTRGTPTRLTTSPDRRYKNTPSSFFFLFPVGSSFLLYHTIATPIIHSKHTSESRCRAGTATSLIERATTAGLSHFFATPSLSSPMRGFLQLKASMFARREKKKNRPHPDLHTVVVPRI